MHVIHGATLRPGAAVKDAAGETSTQVTSGQKRLIRGKALIFWDPTLAGTKYGKKRDAIDTDQITPAADCVSETLETLDERWKAGAFRYLMPDFRARVHRGETFVIAGDRFAIGSSREMSPAGLKAIAEEVGLEMVIICGENMGDIFRRNALNLGLHVVQSPEAVADARDGDEFSFDAESRQIANMTRGKVYVPKPLTPKEDELRKTGGIVAAGRRELRSSIERQPRIEFPDEHVARTLTTTEQIVWAHRVDKDQRVKPGDTLRVYADLLPASDGTAPFAIHTFNQITQGLIYPRQAAIANDHFVFTGRQDDDKQTGIGRAFAREQGLKPP
jgi:3-isopropylmalate/(R)-2-methylmalate dehydratase small subunit